MERRAVAALGSLLCALGQSAVALGQTGSRTPAHGPAAIQAQVQAEAQLQNLGSFEQKALRHGLMTRGLVIDPAPDGKTVRRLHVVNMPVFGVEEGFLRWFNRFHVTSREEVVAREVLLQPGDPWDEGRLDETRRRLRDPLFTALVVAAPVRAEGGAPGEVDLLVVTRDIWSLRMNSNYEVQQDVLSALSLSLAENNLFGLRKQIALVFNMDLGKYTLGPRYLDNNIAGTRLTLASQADAVFNRYTSELEGTQSTTSFAYPFWSLDSKWGASVDVTHFDAVRRSFFGTELRGYETAEGVVLPWEYDELDVDVESIVARQTGDSVKHRFGVGHRLELQRPEVRDDFPGDDAAREEFEREVLPRSERSSTVFARYTLFTPTYAVYRNVSSFDLAEDQRLGPEIIAELGTAVKPLGSEVNFLSGSLSFGWAFALPAEGLVRLNSSATFRREDGDYIDMLRSAEAIAVSPQFFGMRLAARAHWSGLFDDTGNRFFTLGGDNGLRGYPINAFIGNAPEAARVLANVELRSQAVPVLFTRVGGILFWDAGHAADCYRGCESPLTIHQDVGFGMRVLIPQMQPYVFRFDWAVPLTGSTAGLPGRFIAGVNQVF
jgi:Omp85 superfamily domain